jgi:hypothetical protein
MKIVVGINQAILDQLLIKLISQELVIGSSQAVCLAKLFANAPESQWKLLYARLIMSERTSC